MEPLIINQNFCEPDDFFDQCLDILCGDKGVFKTNCKGELKGIYESMRQNLNVPQYKIEPFGGENICSGIKRDCITRNDEIYAGHDLPVWLNTPTTAEHRIMVVSQDPRRNDKEMANGSYEVGISTPFGLHSMEWRSNKKRGFVHWLFDTLLKEYGENMSVYYTDVYKFRGVGNNSKLDTPNFDIYKDILRQEIALFKPSVILLMGSKAQKAYHDVMDECIMNLPAKPEKIETPHPNARVVDNHWGKYKMEKFDIASKIELISREIIKKL